jgi:dienelactone hydrolase
MRYLLFSLVVCGIVTNPVLAQKPSIDSTVYGRWPSLRGNGLTDNGKFAFYVVLNMPIGGQTLVILSTESNWRVEIAGGDQCAFTPDSRKALFSKSGDSLGILTLGGSDVKYIAHVNSFELAVDFGDEWLAYQTDISPFKLTVQNLVLDKTWSFDAITHYWFGRPGLDLLLQRRTGVSDSNAESLSLFNFERESDRRIWRGSKAWSIIADRDHSRMAFLAAGPNHSSDSNDSLDQVGSIWYFDRGRDSASPLACEHAFGVPADMHFESIDGFSADGKVLFAEIKRAVHSISKRPDAVSLDVWSYADSKLQSQQMNELGNARTYKIAIRFSDTSIIQLEHDNEEFAGTVGNWVLINSRAVESGAGECKWNALCRYSTYLVSTINNERRLLNKELSLDYSISPKGRYLLYYNPDKACYYSYEIASGRTFNLTHNIRTTWREYDYDRPDPGRAVNAFAAWMEGDTSVVLQDQTDLWLVDLSAKKSPVNITNGFGGRNGIVFRLAVDRQELPLRFGEKLLLSAYDRNTKDNGFYYSILGNGNDPVRRYMGPFLFYIHDYFRGDAPLKAKAAEKYIVTRMNANEFPNYFTTSDFVAFRPLSDLFPERKYNWMTTSLVSWKMANGRINQGVLYKPEDFDPKRRYPVIIYYYEKMSDRLHLYLEPDAAHGPIDIPWFVSNGYLVFAPDIHYKVGDPQEGIVNCVVSAGRRLAKMPFVNPGKIGIQGHSFGGYETNVVVTHTHMFAAACSASGIADLVSEDAAIGDQGASLEGMVEDGQDRMGTSPWIRPDLFIKNSPIFQANRVTTPLLMMHTKKDGTCPFPNALSFFIALRRLGKKVWLLQYDDGSHGVWGISAADYSIRLAQFFGHYLKDQPAPSWMTRGIPAEQKGIDDGLKIDPPVDRLN